MHPTELIELIFVGFLASIIVIITLFLKGNWRKVGWALAIVVIVAYCIFFVVRPYWIDAQIDKKVALLKPYLEQQYPNEEWVISTVPHRKAGYKHLNPYVIGVVFASEPEVTYGYWVENKNDIYQRSYSTNNRLDDLEHMENDKK
jgi:hypothetical protein